MFPRRQNKYNLPRSSNSKSLHPPALNVLCCLLEHESMFSPYIIAMYESPNYPPCEKINLKIIQSLLERVQICRNRWKTKECAGAVGFFWRTADSWTAQQQLSLNRKTVVDHPGNNTRYSDSRVCKLLNRVIFINSVIILSCGEYINICYAK